VTRHAYYEVFSIYWPIGLGVGVLVWVLVIGVLWRRRAARVGDGWPEGSASNTPLEIGYAALIACVVAMLLYFTYSSMTDYETAAATSRGEVVRVRASQWNWRFDWPKYGITSQGKGAGRVLPTLTVPVGTPIHFRGESNDVIHSFLISHERFQRQLFPGRVVKWTMSFGRGWLGHHTEGGECVQFCGIYHSFMKFDVNVLTKPAYRRWVQQHRTTGTAA
jgi:cytochrome c oxidase subunit 2